MNRTPRRYGYRQALSADRIADNTPSSLVAVLIDSALRQLERTARAEGDHLELATLSVTFAPGGPANTATGQVDMCVEVQGTEQGRPR